MSTCISRHGEYSEHITDERFCCQRCFAFDEDAALAEIDRLRSAPPPVVAAKACEACHGARGQWESTRTEFGGGFDMRWVHCGMCVAGDPSSWAEAGWMQTFSGGKFHPLAPSSEDVQARDIAHALSLLCRYNGHVDRFYSVAEHCLLLSYAVPEEFALHALLHDATEAYVGDMIRPLKRSMPEYVVAEDRVMVAIAARFGLSAPYVPQVVKDADSRILLDERAALLRVPPSAWAVEDLEPLGVEILAMSPVVAEHHYWNRLVELTNGAPL